MNDWAEFRHFKYLLAIVEQMGFRAAAEFLHTAQPNLSFQAKQFQEALGVHLFERTSGGHIRLTATGVAFKAIAHGVLDVRDEAIAALIAVEQGDIRSLRLGCGPCVDHRLFHMACDVHKELIPGCQIRPVHGGSVQLAEELISGEIDAALVTSPISDRRLHVEEIWRDRLLVCLRADHPLASSTALRPEALQGNLTVLIDPQRHPAAHAQLAKFLEEAGVHLDEYSRVSHPTEMQALVKDGYGFALICEGITLDAELITRPVAGANWALGTAFAYNKQRHPKTVPVLVRHLKRRLVALANQDHVPVAMIAHTKNDIPKRPPRPESQGPVQLSLLG